MLVDDKPSVLAGLRQLGDWAAMGVVLGGEALDGASALRLAETSPPDILLTDIHMPIMDGLELSRRVLERWPQVKVILLTGYDQFEYVRAALRLGAVEFLTKPATIDEIRAAVRRAAVMLDEQAAAAAEREGLRRQVQRLLLGDGAATHGDDAVRSGQQSRQAAAVAQVRQYIQAHLGKDCSLSALAEVVHLNPTYLAELFKRHTGQTVLEYVTQAKMERAKLRLVSSDDKVTTICDELGYSDQRHFVDLFRRTTGVTPTEYRAQVRPDRRD